MDQQKLIAACARGDRQAQRHLYDLYAPKLLVVGLRYSKTRIEAEDVLQESFIKIFRNIDKLRDNSNLMAWMKRIVINTAINQHRKKLYMFPMVDIEKVRHSYDASESLADFHIEELIKLIQELPTGCQIIFNMFAIEGYSHKEIAEKLNISEGTSKSQYSRARGLLQNRIQEDRKKNYEKLR
jgi:RNA polymerase sigma-70 factor (ECF subfamily)